MLLCTWELFHAGGMEKEVEEESWWWHGRGDGGGTFSWWCYGRGGGGIKKKSFSLLNFTCRQLSKYELTNEIKQWWSTIPPISTKQTITSHLDSLNTKQTMTYDIGNLGSGLGQAQKCKWDRLVSYCRVFNNEGPGQTKSASMLFTCESVQNFYERCDWSIWPIRAHVWPSHVNNMEADFKTCKFC